jgi:acyl-CoA synthetase (AMP-forming)/AMP-acid ligase II
MNVVEPILYQCNANPPAPAICVPGTQFNLVSYARLGRFIHSTSRHALELGLRRGDVVAVFVSDPILHAAIVFGLMHIGIVTLSGRNPELPPELKIDALIADSDFPYRAPKIIRADASWIGSDKGPLEDKYVPPTDPDDICRIIVTSGTTGDPKAVAVSHRMMADRSMRRLTYYGDAMMRCSRTFCAAGLSSSLGLQVLIFMLWRGGTAFFSGENIELLLRTFVEFEVENMVTAPASLAGLVESYEQDPDLHHNWKAVLVGGSLLTPPLADRTRKQICPTILHAYGTTETGMVACAPYQTITNIPGAVGRLLPGISVEIVDDAGRVLPADTEGAVRIRGPSDVDGYIGDPEQSREAFRDGWFYPGDVGSISAGQLLRITGRVKPVLNLGGEKVKPEAVEEVVVSFEGIGQAAVFTTTNALGIEELWCAVVPREAWNEGALRMHCAGKLPPDLIPAGFVVLKELPLNATGKIDRRRLAEISRAKVS